jgi:hypothetical protein
MISAFRPAAQTGAGSFFGRHPVPVKWSRVAPYLEAGFASEGRVERSGIVDRMYDDGADDDVVDTVDAIGSRVFNSVDEARQFLLAQGLVED